MNQVIRVIGGHYRGKKITFPVTNGLRPTPARVRETLFNWIMHEIRTMRCLDAFSGSGALGIEAFSRGAIEICCIEQNPIVFKNLQKIISSFNSDNFSVINADTCDFMRHTKKTFNMVFLDPPFSEPLLTPCLTQLYQSQILETGGFVYFESPHKLIPNPVEWELLKQKKAGLVFYGLLKKR